MWFHSNYPEGAGLQNDYNGPWQGGDFPHSLPVPGRDPAWSGAAGCLSLIHILPWELPPRDGKRTKNNFPFKNKYWNLRHNTRKYHKELAPVGNNPAGAFFMQRILVNTPGKPWNSLPIHFLRGKQAFSLLRISFVFYPQFFAVSSLLIPWLFIVYRI